MNVDSEFIAFIHGTLEPQILPVYRQSYPNGDERIVHGAIHVSRCIIFAECMLTHYVRDLGVPETRFDTLAIRLALAWHDAGRQGEGPDEWEHDSARLAVDFATRHGMSEGRARYVGDLIMHERRDPTDPNAHVVQACDTLDILRVFPVAGFKPDLFGFLHPELDPVAARSKLDVRQRVIDEAADWIDRTEGFWERRRLDGSATCCQDLLRDVTGAGRYPTLAGLLPQLAPRAH